MRFRCPMRKYWAPTTVFKRGIKKKEIDMTDAQWFKIYDRFQSGEISHKEMLSMIPEDEDEKAEKAVWRDSCGFGNDPNWR